MVIVLGMFASLVVLLGGLAVAYFSASNYAVGMEARIKAVHTDNQNVLASYSQKVSTAVQVPGMAKDDLKEVVQAAIQGRYGAGGSKAVFQMITEQNPTIDPELYRKIQFLIESGQDEFKLSQTRLLDVKRSYEQGLGTAPRSFFLSMAGFPRIDLSKYNIVTDDYTDESFKSGKQKGLTLRPAAPKP